MLKNDKGQLLALSAYVQGFADAQQNPKLADAADFIAVCSQMTCGQGVIGCYGGEKCGSDHK